MMRALSYVRHRYKFVRLISTSFLTRSVAAAAHPYHSFPADDYLQANHWDGYNSRYDDRNRGYVDWTRRSCDGFMPTQSIHHWRYDSPPPYWRSYGEGWGVEGYPIWENELCPSCREACYWGSDAYAQHWVRDRNVQPPVNVDYYGNVHGSRPYYYAENFNPDFYQYRRDTNSGHGYYYDDWGREFQGGEHPAWRSEYSTKLSGESIPSSRAHENNYDMRRNENAARHNQGSQDVYGLHGYDQNNQTRRTMNYNRNTVAESSRFERPDLTFQGQAHPNRLYSENQRESHDKPTMGYGVYPNAVPNDSSSIPKGNGGEIKYERRNQSNQPLRYMSEHPNRCYSDNKYGFQKISAEHRSSFNYNPEAEGKHYSHYTEVKDGRVLGTPDIKNNASVNSGHKESSDGGRRRDVDMGPQSFTAKEELRDKMTDKMGNPYQSPTTYPQASNEAATHSGQQQSQATSSRYTKKIDINQHQAQQQSSDCDFLGDIKPVQSPTLNTVLSDGCPLVLNSGRQTENLETEQIRGSLEELETFTKEGKLMLAVKVLDVMEKKKDRLDPERDLSKIKLLIQACGDSKAITEAKAVHKHIENLMSPLKFSLYNKILGMYLKCGAISDACSMFYNMAAHNLTSWDTMIKGLVKNNLGEEALDVFAEFKNATDSEPDGLMFLGVFSACRLVGDVIEGMMHFESMTKQYRITPCIKHYVSIVDMMGHVGHLDEAMEFIEKMPVKPSVDVWETMMNACRIHGNTEIGDRCAEAVQKLDPNRSSDESKAGINRHVLDSLKS